jgi:hypothetical protein
VVTAAPRHRGGLNPRGHPREPGRGTARTPNLAFDFDDALLQLDDALLQLADPGLELLDELTECAILGLKVDVARYAG